VPVAAPIGGSMRAGADRSQLSGHPVLPPTSRGSPTWGEMISCVPARRCRPR